MCTAANAAGPSNPVPLNSPGAPNNCYYSGNWYYGSSLSNGRKSQTRSQQPQGRGLSQLFSGLVGALIGGLIGALATIGAARMTLRSQFNEQRKRDNETATWAIYSFTAMAHRTGAELITGKTADAATARLLRGKVARLSNDFANSAPVLLDKLPSDRARELFHLMVNDLSIRFSNASSTVGRDEVLFAYAVAEVIQLVMQGESDDSINTLKLLIASKDKWRDSGVFSTIVSECLPKGIRDKILDS